MKPSVKAQSAVEYMMTYGWAILVILGMGLVLWQMGVFDLGQDTTPGSRGFSQVVPVDWKCSMDQNLLVTVTNQAGVILNLSEANATLVAGGSGVCTGSITGDSVAVFRPGQSQQISFSGCPVTEESGDYFRAEVGIVYANPASGIEHLSYGKIWGPLE